MRGARIGLLVLLTLGLGCRSAKSVPEPGAALLHVKCAAGSPSPDELRTWVYDDDGVLWNGMRIPASGPLVKTSDTDLGTVLIQPGAFRGALRVHVRGLAGGTRILDGALSIPSLAGAGKTYDILLDPAAPTDVDGDDVPDVIDDCPGSSNPAQGGCPAAPATDGGSDVPLIETGLADSPSDSPSLVSDTDTLAVGPNVGSDVGPESDVPTSISDGYTAEDATVDMGTEVGGTGEVDSKPDSRGVAVDAIATADSSDTGGPAACIDGGVCNQSQGALCAKDAECASGFCADGVCCTNSCAGPCRSCSQPSATGICQGYAPGTDPELECSSGTTCNGAGACGPSSPPNLANGQLCSTVSQCTSGFCKDGVCCDSACTSPCQACGTGTCLAVKRTSDVPECTGTMTCNPKGNCVAN